MSVCRITTAVPSIREGSTGLARRRRPIPKLTRANITRIKSYIGPVNHRGCRHWLASKNKNGYGQIKIAGDVFLVTRVAYKLATGKDAGQLNVNHTCDNPGCCAGKHLWAGTQKQNNEDKSRKERQSRGIEHGHHKLTEKQVRRIRALTGIVPQKLLALRYDVNVSCISKIQNWKLWKHLK